MAKRAANLVSRYRPVTLPCGTVVTIHALITPVYEGDPENPDFVEYSERFYMEVETHDCRIQYRGNGKAELTEIERTPK